MEKNWGDTPSVTSIQAKLGAIFSIPLKFIKIDLTDDLRSP